MGIPVDLSLGSELSGSHLAGLKATVHWTTSFLAWRDGTDRGEPVSRENTMARSHTTSSPQGWWVEAVR
jgi:hypothetical protein